MLTESLARQRRAQGRLTDDDVRARIARLGRAAFEEVRTVLVQENYLRPGMDDYRAYAEFAAVYLELRFFRGNLRGTYFPALRASSQRHGDTKRPHARPANLARVRVVVSEA